MPWLGAQVLKPRCLGSHQLHSGATLILCFLKQAAEMMETFWGFDEMINVKCLELCLAQGKCSTNDYYLVWSVLLAQGQCVENPGGKTEHNIPGAGQAAGGGAARLRTASGCTMDTISGQR